MFTSIASNAALSDPNNYSALPRKLNVAYKFREQPPERVRKWIKEGKIHTEMKMKEADAVLSGHPTAKEKKVERKKPHRDPAKPLLLVVWDEVATFHVKPEQLGDDEVCPNVLLVHIFPAGHVTRFGPHSEDDYDIGKIDGSIDWYIKIPPQKITNHKFTFTATHRRVCVVDRGNVPEFAIDCLDESTGVDDLMEKLKKALPGARYIYLGRTKKEGWEDSIPPKKSEEPEQPVTDKGVQQVNFRNSQHQKPK